MLVIETFMNHSLRIPSEVCNALHPAGVISKTFRERQIGGEGVSGRIAEGVRDDSFNGAVREEKRLCKTHLETRKMIFETSWSLLRSKFVV